MHLQLKSQQYWQLLFKCLSFRQESKVTSLLFQNVNCMKPSYEINVCYCLFSVLDELLRSSSAVFSSVINGPRMLIYIYPGEQLYDKYFY